MIITTMQSKATAATTPTTPAISPVDALGNGVFVGGELCDGPADSALEEVPEI